MSPHIFADAGLARRLERAEGQSNAEFVEARARLSPEVGARWIEVAGAYVMFDGPQSPLTQTFGLGLFDPVTVAELGRIEEFYRELVAPVFHEVSPMGEAGLAALLGERGYRPVEFTNVLFLPLPRVAPAAEARREAPAVRAVGEEEYDVWAVTAARGWAEFPEVADLMYELGLVSARRKGAVSFMAEVDGRPAATGALSICEGVALLAGASTVPEARRRGAQAALLDARLRHAAERGCDLAMMGALPGSASQRNAERQGFRIAYTRIKWGLMGAA